MNPTIFISYARPNLDFVRTLADLLRANGFGVWFDKDSLLVGDDWESVIIREIKNARIFLVCFSAESMDRRGYFHKEMRVAMDVAQTIPPNVLYVMPIRINKCSIPDALSRYHVLDVFDDKDWQNNLLKSLRRSFPESTGGATLTINTRPITGKDGQVLILSYDPNQFVYSFLTQVFHSMTGFVTALSYGTEWVLRDDETGTLYDAKNEQQRNALRFTTIKDIGLTPNMKLSAVNLRDHRGAKRQLPTPTVDSARPAGV